MTDKEVMERLQALFEYDDTVSIKRSDNEITFSQFFVNNLHIDEAFLEKSRREFNHTVTLCGKGKYKTEDIISWNKKSLFGLDTGYNRGQLYEKGFFVGLGKDVNTGETGLVHQEWSTEYIKAPVREFLDTTGFERINPFWTGKRIAIMFACIWIPIIIGYIVVLLSLH